LQPLEQGQTVVDTKTNNQSPRRSKDRQQHAIECARQRDAWSTEWVRERERHYVSELDDLRRRVEDLSAERDAANRQAELVDNLQQQVAMLATERDTLRRQAERIETLERELAAAISQRDTSGQRAAQLEASLEQLDRHLDDAQRQFGAQSRSSRPLLKPAHRPSTRAATAVGVVLALGVVASAVTFHDAQSTVKTEPGTTGDVSVAAAAPQVTRVQLGTVELAADEKTGSDKKKPAPGGKKNKTRFARTGEVTHRQWGPALFSTDDVKPARSGYVFDPLVQELQKSLLALGFDIGEADGFSGQRTEQAVDEFKALYLSGASLKQPPSRAALAAITRNYADLASDDAATFNVDRGVVAAIRLSSVRTGIEFSYLMKLAAVESNFDPASKAAGSSAAGLYQFTRDTWLNTLKEHGGKYGLERYTGQIEFTVDRNGYRRPVVRDKQTLEHLLALRSNPRLSAMMAAESVRDNAQRLARSFDRPPSEADLYLTHFFGSEGAISFLKALDQTPDAFAVDMFPAAAKSNRDIFQPRTCAPRTVDEVYELFGQKFNSRRFESVASN
jgi:hypothetical protein